MSGHRIEHVRSLLLFILLSRCRKGWEGPMALRARLRTPWTMTSRHGLAACCCQPDVASTELIQLRLRVRIGLPVERHKLALRHPEDVAPAKESPFLRLPVPEMPIFCACHACEDLPSFGNSWKLVQLRTKHSCRVSCIPLRGQSSARGAPGTSQKIVAGSASSMRQPGTFSCAIRTLRSRNGNAIKIIRRFRAEF
jgi:hypothetical protein